MSRYEVRGLPSDKELVRSLAEHLARDGDEAAGLRAEVAQKLAGKVQARGGILAALRRSPLVGAGLRVAREVSAGREVDI